MRQAIARKKALSRMAEIYAAVSAAASAQQLSKAESVTSSLVMESSFLLLAGHGSESQPLPNRMALALINELRALYGFPPDEFSLAWSAKAMKHCEYHCATGHTGHHEDPASPYHTKDGDEAARCSGIRAAIARARHPARSLAPVRVAHRMSASFARPAAMCGR